MLRTLLITLITTCTLQALPMPETNLVFDEQWAVAYSGFRKGQHPDRGFGAKNPTYEQTLEDLEILLEYDFKLIRLYDSGENSKMVLDVIRDNNLPIKVVLGAWLDAEISNHDRCGWLNTPIPEEKLKENIKKNKAEVNQAIQLCRKYKEIITAVSIGNETQIFWHDHTVPEASLLKYIKKVKSKVPQMVTVADDYGWWKDDGARVAKELDFIGIHIHPFNHGRKDDPNCEYSIQLFNEVKNALPDAKIVIMEAGWPTTASNWPEGHASEQTQADYYDTLKTWSKANNIPVFIFEAFDEPWKGMDPETDMGDPNTSEKHWGIFFETREPKLVLQ
jgi:exo-beta-1,3-glucanase (GH17 family)